MKYFPEPGLSYVNHESIYQWFYKPEQKRKSLHKLLPQSHGRRGRRRRVNRSSIPNRVSIHDRPTEIDSREEIGHWEADLMSCQRGSQHLLVLVERKNLPEELKKSITFDNGTEFTNHQELLEELGIKSKRLIKHRFVPIFRGQIFP